MKKSLLFLVGIFLFCQYIQSAVNILHKFAGGTNDGQSPSGSLILSGTTLYGMTDYGGDNDKGTIFRIEVNGTGFTLLHEFAGGNNDGAEPRSSLILSGTTLFGTTYRGGTYDNGTIFKIETNGTGFTLLHEFQSRTHDGCGPECSLVLSGTTLYGMNSESFDDPYDPYATYVGTIFKIETNGTGFTVLHEFTGDDGWYPEGSLIISGTTLFGMTEYGGAYSNGTIFKIETDGNGFSLLHEFAGGDNDGVGPRSGSLLLSGTTLFGMTQFGGAYSKGTIFKIETNGTGFVLLHKFAGGANDGSSPFDSLVLSGTTLFGMTDAGGYYDQGTVFRIEIDGTGFSLLHKFAGGLNDGAGPSGSLTLSGNTLYGMTSDGGNNNNGIIFSSPTEIFVSSDFNSDGVTDLVWRHYAADGGNTVWLMSEATPPAAECENVGAGCQPAQEEIDNVGAELASAPIDGGEGPAPASPLQDVCESALPEGEGISTEFPEAEYPGPFSAISVLSNVPLPALADLTWKICGTGDFNGDYKVDILWRYYGTGGSNAVWLMDGTNKTSAVALPAQTDVKWEIVGAGDFNNDQKVDIVWRHKTNGKNMIWLMNGLTRSSIVNLPTQSNLTWKIAGCGDFNGDGKCDILWRFQGTGGKNQVWLMNGTARQSIVTIKAETNTKWQIAGVGDFNKDGKSDIIWRNYSTGGANRIWIMNNTAYVRTETLPAVADLKWKIEN